MSREREPQRFTQELAAQRYADEHPTYTQWIMNRLKNSMGVVGFMSLMTYLLSKFTLKQLVQGGGAVVAVILDFVRASEPTMYESITDPFNTDTTYLESWNKMFQGTRSKKNKKSKSKKSKSKKSKRRY